MYWEKGYKWQEIREEQFFCIECVSGCRSGHQINVERCNSGNPWFEFLNMESDGTAQIMVAETDLCIELVVRITIELQQCDASLNYTRQKFIALNGNFLWSKKFEIGTVHHPGGYLSQQHHPKSGEIDCPETRDDGTSFWMRY
jgi:hypothetical protein